MITVGRRAPAGRPWLLALRALGLGDLLTAVPALRALHRHFPEHERVLVAPAFLAPLVALLDGAVDRMVDVDFRTQVAALPATLPAVDVAVNLHGRGPQSHRALRALRPHRLLAFADEAGDGAPAARGEGGGAALGATAAGVAAHPPAGAAPRWDDDEHERMRWCRMLGAFGVRADPDDLRLRAPDAPPDGGFAGATIVHPGAAAAARRWPPQRWAAVARHELGQGRRVVVTGSGAEAELAATVAAAAGVDPRWVVAGRTDLVELAALVAAAGRVVCGDTGVAHLASALGTPSVVLFGPTSPARWGPPAAPWHVALWAGRGGDPHGATPDPGLLAIGVADVVTALDGLPVRAEHAVR